MLGSSPAFLQPERFPFPDHRNTSTCSQGMLQRHSHRQLPVPQRGNAELGHWQQWGRQKKHNKNPTSNRRDSKPWPGLRRVATESLSPKFPKQIPARQKVWDQFGLGKWSSLPCGLTPIPPSARGPTGASGAYRCEQVVFGLTHSLKWIFCLTYW